MQSIWSISPCFDGALYSPLTLSLARRTNTSCSLPPLASTALYFTSLVLQNSASLRFFGTFISGALPVKLTTPLIVAVPIAPPPALSLAVCAGAAVAVGVGVVALVAAV